MLTVDEMLDLVSLLPLRAAIPDDADDLLEPLERWVAADAGRNLAWPVVEIRTSAVSALVSRRLLNRQ